MLFLVVLGGAAVLEVHRALHHGGSKDVQEIKRKEEQLRRQLQELQRELQQAKSQRELTEKEATQLAELNQQLQHDKEELERQSSNLKAANEELARQAAQLEMSTGALQQENANLLQQFDRLRIKYEEESSAFHQQLAELKEQVGGALQQFAAGELSAESLLAFLSGMGVEVRCSPEEAEAFPSRLAQLADASSREERLQLLEKVELSVDDSWMHQLRLSSCPDRAARLLRAAREPAASSAPALTYQQPKKLPTPDKSRSEAAPQLPVVPLLKLAGATNSAAAEGVAEAGAAAPAGLQGQQVPQLQAAPAALQPAASSSGHVLRPVQDNKSRSLRFLPSGSGSKKLGSKGLATPRLEMDLSLGSENASGGALGGSSMGDAHSLGAAVATGAAPLGRALLGGRQLGGQGEREEELLGPGSRSLMAR